MDYLIGGQSTGVDRNVLYGRLCLGRGRELAILCAPRLGVVRLRLLRWWERLLLLIRRGLGRMIWWAAVIA